MNTVSESELYKCRCGGKPRYRYRIPCHWIECKKCGMKTGYIKDKREQFDPVSVREAVEEWNRMVKDDGRQDNLH